MANNQAPPICPRCGSKKFSSIGVRTNFGNTISGSYTCRVCGLTFVEDHWEDVTGEDWVMAESGT